MSRASLPESPPHVGGADVDEDSDTMYGALAEEDVLGKLGKDWPGKVLGAAKWQDKKDLLDKLLSLTSAPRLAVADYSEVSLHRSRAAPVFSENITCTLWFVCVCGLLLRVLWLLLVKVLDLAVQTDSFILRYSAIVTYSDLGRKKPRIAE